MADKIRANYPAMQEMAKQLELVVSRLTELAATENRISQQMQAGALQGPPGDALVGSLATAALKIKALADKIETESKGITAAISDMQQADSSAAGDFK